MVGPSILLAKETKTRLSNLKSGYKALIFLPLTVSVLVSYVIFAMEFLSDIPILNLSWLGYNIVIGPFADQGVFGILPFIPLLGHYCTLLWVSLSTLSLYCFLLVFSIDIS
jgi:ABC-type sugar transport system permease subunit